MNSLGLCLRKSAPCGWADLEEGVGRALEGSRSRSQTLVQIAEASKEMRYKCQPACSGWGKSRPCNLVYYLGLDAHLVGDCCKMGDGNVLYWRGKGGLGMGKRAREGGAGLRGVHSLGGEQDLECQALRAIMGP